jgi:glucosamine-6-phosphate deaminase
MTIRIIITSDYDHLSETAFEVVRRDIRRRLRQKSEYALGLATGSSPIGLYKHLAYSAHQANTIRTACAPSTWMNTWACRGENAQQRTLHPASYGFFMATNCLSAASEVPGISLTAGNLIEQPELIAHLRKYPGDWREMGTGSGHAIKIKARPESPYLAWIRANILEAYPRKNPAGGGIDLQVIGVGGNGHVAFHEAGIPFHTDTFSWRNWMKPPSPTPSPTGIFFVKDALSAVSMSASLVFQARTVVLLAAGQRKVEPIRRSLLDPPTCDCPLSYGQRFTRKAAI